MKSRKVKSIFKVIKWNPRKQKRPAGRGEEEITDKIGMTFGFDASEWERIRRWQKLHKCKYRKPDGSQYYGCIGGGYEYRFTPTSIGMLAEIRCACGEKLDVDRI